MVSYIGSKNRISKFIIPFIPNDIETYVEVFGGAYWVYFNMDLKKFPNLKTIVYNDINPLNSNLFKCVQEDPNKLFELCEYIPIENEELYYQYQKELFPTPIINEPDYHMAYKYVYLLSQLWSGNNPEKGKMVRNGGYISKSNAVYLGKFDIFRNKLQDEKWIKMFQSINFVENMDYKDVINKYDSPTTYFYIDPPYYNTEKYYSNHQFGINEHIELISLIKTMNGKFSLSYYDFDLLSEWLPKDKYRWESKEFTKSSGIRKGKTPSKGLELVIMNY